jgi:hypothetical protein
VKFPCKIIFPAKENAGIIPRNICRKEKVKFRVTSLIPAIITTSERSEILLKIG